MSFSNFKSNKTKEELKVELSVLEKSLTDEMPEGDKRVIEKSIIKLKGKLELIEDTTSADIANVEQNLFSPCTGKPGCECGKCELLKRPELSEAIQTKSPFSNFFGR